MTSPVITAETLRTARRHALRTVVGATVAHVLLRRSWLRSGATSEEVHADLPGDAFIDPPMLQATRATTIEAPPEAVWPWLAQMGHGRAGWYSYDWVDNGGTASLVHLDPELQSLAVGTRIDDATGPFSFEVVQVVPPTAVVYRACIHPVTGRPVPPEHTDPSSTSYADAFLDFTWALVVQPDAQGSRLLSRVRYRHSRGLWLTALVNGFELVDAVFARRMFTGLRARIESSHEEEQT